MSGVPRADASYGFAVGLPDIGPVSQLFSLSSETKWRSLGKTLSYRVFAIALLAMVTYTLTGNPGETTMVTIVFNASAAVAYYGFERLWGAVNWGKRELEGSPTAGVALALQKATDGQDLKRTAHARALGSA